MHSRWGDCLKKSGKKINTFQFGIRFCDGPYNEENDEAEGDEEYNQGKRVTCPG